MIFVWIIAYGGVYAAGEFLSAGFEVAYSVTSFALLLYAAALIFWSAHRKDGVARYRLAIHAEESAKGNTWRAVVRLLPLFVFPVCNLLVLKNAWDFYYLLVSVGVCIVEELFFRGYLFGAFPKRRGIGALVSSGVFALLHLVNFSSVSAEIQAFDVILQTVSAFGVGLCFCGITLAYDSLLPATALHFFINATGVGAPHSKVWQVVAVLACSLFYALYGWIQIYRHTRTGEKE